MSSSSEWHDVRGADLLLRLRIQPRASREGIDGVHDGRLRVRVSSPPVGGAANDRLIRILAQALDMPRSALSLTRGMTSRNKDVLIHAPAARHRELIARLSQPPESSFDGSS